MQLVERFEVRCDCSENSTCSGYLALLHSERAVAVVFRGTSTDEQLRNEVLAGVLPRPTFFGMGGVHKYFHDAYLSLWLGGMGAALERLHRRHPDYRTWVTGHSLGAALASLASADLVSSGRLWPRNSHHYNFA